MQSPRSFPLIGITPQPFPLEQQKLMNRLFQQGLDYLYIRSGEKDAAAWQQVLKHIDPDFHSRLLLPANAPAEAAGGHYIRHLREVERLPGQLPPPEPGKLYSTSIHHLNQVPGLGGRYSLVFYSPVFPSISKAGYRPQQPWDDLVREMADLPQQERRTRLIGLGGVNAANIDCLQAAGFSGAALLGALWQAPCPERALAEIQAQIKIARP